MILYSYRDKKKAGYCHLLQTRFGDYEIAYLHVEPEHRGFGIATQLIKRAQRIAEKEQRWLVGFLDPDGTGLTREQERVWLKRHGFKYEPKYNMAPMRPRSFNDLLRRGRPNYRPVMIWIPEILRAD